MAIRSSTACTECRENLRRVRRGKSFLLCEDCRRTVTTRRWKIRGLKRSLVEGALVQFNTGCGGRTGYLLKIHELRGDIQPIGAIGRIPPVSNVSLADVRPAWSPSCQWPTVDDFYHANKKTEPLVLVAKPPYRVQSEVQRPKNESSITSSVQEVNVTAETSEQFAVIELPDKRIKHRASREQIEEMLRAGTSYRKIAAACGVSLGHITTVKKEMVTK